MNAAAQSIWLDAAREVAERTGQAVETRVAERRTHPEIWACFHRRMAATLPRWRWIARAWHVAMARRMAALAGAQRFTE